MNGYEICLAIFGGFFAGCINTLAGNGSIITLGIMTELLGLSGNMANGTNRVGIFVQGIFSLEAFARNKKIHWSKTSSYLITGLIGAIIGAWVAVQISSEDFKLVYKYLMLVLLVILLIHPKHWSCRQ